METPWRSWWTLQYWRARWDSLTPEQQAVGLQRFGLGLIILISLAGLLVLSSAYRKVGHFKHPTLVYDQSGKPWFDLHDPFGTHLKLAEMPPYLAQAVIAIEDRRFYSHGAFDIRGMGRALWRNLTSAQVREGASTLSQQLARQVFLTHRRTVSRKLQEALLAYELENQFDKEEILEGYLNRVFMGGSLYGMPAAARYFFGKDVKQITLSEAATLAAIIQSPNFYNPKINPDAVIRRRNAVLANMLQENFIQPDLYEKALGENVKFVRRRSVERTEIYFKEFLRSELVEVTGEWILDEYGYKIHSSYSPQLQQLAENSANQEIARLESGKQLYKYPEKPELQVGMVSIEVETGRMNAMVAGRNYGGSQYNHVTQALRQPGSAFKPIVYTTALLRGYIPPARIETVPVSPNDVSESADIAGNEPREITLREGLAKSVNEAAVALIRKIGIAPTMETARRLGIKSDLPPYESLALGAGEVRVLELTQAFSVFAARGNLATPHCVIQVEDSEGRTVYQEKQRPMPVLSPEIAYQITSMLRDVVSRGTAATAATAGMGFPIAGKTGTTNDYKDAWFVGFSPKLVCGVWVGYDNPKPIMPGGYGGRVALPIWGRYMRGTARLMQHGNFAIPRTLRGYSLCRVSGGLATEGCNYAMRPDGTIYSAVYTEYLIPGTEPNFLCPIHAVTPQEGEGIFEKFRKWLPKVIPIPRDQPTPEQRPPR
ncbi:MAG TPA: PBP1A family penicillin-binding protein [Acidobacteriota bacterium]|jgi:1A family penicillin-binding protein